MALAEFHWGRLNIFLRDDIIDVRHIRINFRVNAWSFSSSAAVSVGSNTWTISFLNEKNGEIY